MHQANLNMADHHSAPLPAHLVQLVDPPISSHHGTTPSERLLSQIILTPEGQKELHLRVTRINTLGRRESLSLIFLITEVLVVYTGGVHETIQISLGRQEVRKRGTAGLILRLGINHCGAFDPSVLFVVWVSAGLQWHGKELISLALTIMKWLKCTRTMLIDGAIVGCPSGELYDLSLFILLRYGTTWYMQQGFHPTVPPGVSCGGPIEKLNTNNLQTVRQIAKRIIAVTIAEVRSDAQEIIKNIQKAITTHEIIKMQFDEKDIWKRERKISTHDSTFSYEFESTIFRLMRHMEHLLILLPTTKRIQNNSCVGWMINLKNSNCSAFYELYTQLFDNELYYWRFRHCTYHLRYNEKYITFRLASHLQMIVTALDPSECGEMWYEYVSHEK